MASNSFGHLFRLTTFGESHGIAIGGVVDGCPAGLGIDLDFINNELAKRRPGQSAIVTQRKEEDEVEIISGIFEGKTTGASIGFVIKNNNQKSQDYTHIKDSFRPSHADYTYYKKYGNRDYRGGGRSSARETACRVVGGAIAKLLLTYYQIDITAYVYQVGDVKILKDYHELDFSKIESNNVRCPDKMIAAAMESKIKAVRKSGDTIGGCIKCVIQNVPVGLGAPVFDKLQADIGKAMLGINAVKGFEYGSGFSSVTMKGSEHNDLFQSEDTLVTTKTNNSGGIQGGISNGEDIYFNVAFKPVATIMQSQESLDKDGNKVVVEAKGRHDPCVVPRAVPIVESMAALVIADHLLRNKTAKL